MAPVVPFIPLIIAALTTGGSIASQLLESGAQKGSSAARSRLEDSQRKEALRKRQVQKTGGRSGTILTSPQGVLGDSASIQRPTLLGG